MKKVNATGVVFKRAGKIYDFLTNGVQLKRGDFAIIETEKGEDLATVVFPDREIIPAEGQEFKKIIRKATEQDIENLKKNREEEPKALEECKKLVEQHGLEMKLLKAEYTLDRTRVTFYFTADGRVDFRQLVRDLARIFKTRIEMRQVGVRDATKILGGFGICGREFCCSTFLRNFDNISIKMAKDQNLLLNPGKISGVCGRLMCCLMYEKDGYDVVEEGVEYVELKDFIDENTGGKI
ncbi:stage 0 sporulation family protein [Deferribacterales bacterium Es71-Z0220]|uniref:PSP1 domain-containing protein n=1 Tax=Deferrivibrio essentukiensis TaxID=2880922 RepID=UPI001F61C8E9|nr:stage 0 sporulation family protein [Deferrivibrio essentukiensis]